jgi:outer membrane protein assembly factor BamB
MDIWRSVLLAAAGTSLACPGFAAGVGSMFRGEPTHAGVYQASAPDGLSLKWSFQTPEAIVSSPTVFGGAVYFGSSDNFLYALDAGTGKLRWRFDAHGNVGSSPAVSDGLVFAVSLDGNLYAVDAGTGVKKWAFATLGERRHTAAGMDYAAPSTEVMPDPWDLFLSSPTVAAGVVYFGSGDTFVYAVEAATGKLLWKFKTSGVVHASPSVGGGRVYVGGFDSYFYALDAATGALEWRFKTGDDPGANLMTGIPGSAAIDDGLVIFGCRDGNVYALDARNGERRWQFPTNGSWVIATPAIAGGMVYVTTSDSLKFEALDARTGAEVYSLPYDAYCFSSPSIAGNHAFFGTFDGKLHVVDLATRKYSGQFAVPGLALNGPRYLDSKGRLNSAVVWTGDTLDDVIVDLRTKVFSLGSILSSPAIEGGVVYFGSVDGTLYALGR